MSITALNVGTVVLSAGGENELQAVLGEGCIGANLKLDDMTTGDSIAIRWLTIVDGGSVLTFYKEIEWGVTTDDTWEGTFGSTTAGYQTPPLVCTANGQLTVERLAGVTFDVGYAVFDVA